MRQLYPPFPPVTTAHTAAGPVLGPRSGVCYVVGALHAFPFPAPSRYMAATLPKHIVAYYDALKDFNARNTTSEGAVRIAFQNVLDDAGRAKGVRGGGGGGRRRGGRGARRV